MCTRPTGWRNSTVKTALSQHWLTPTASLAQSLYFWPTVPAISTGTTGTNLHFKLALDAHSLHWQWQCNCCQPPLSLRRSTASHLDDRGGPAAKTHLWSNWRDSGLRNRKHRVQLEPQSCCVWGHYRWCWVWITPYLLFPLLNFGHFPLFHLFGLLLLLLFEGVVVSEEAVKGCEGNSVALPIVILIWTQKQKHYLRNTMQYTVHQIFTIKCGNVADDVEFEDFTANSACNEPDSLCWQMQSGLNTDLLVIKKWNQQQFCHLSKKKCQTLTGSSNFNVRSCIFSQFYIILNC